MTRKKSNRKQQEELRRRQRRILNRIRPREFEDQARPVMGATNIQYEIAVRDRGIGGAGIGVIHRMVTSLGLVEGINRAVQVFKRRVPYFESDHVLAMTYNVLLGGTCLDDMERLRSDEALLDALGAQRLPDPTTAGDFTRRLAEADIVNLMGAINEARLKVWAKQPDDFFEQAVIDADGTLAPTDGERKEGMDITFKGDWGYHPLLVSLANTQEPLFLANRSGSRPSHEGAAVWLDRSVELARRAGFRRVLLRGDTDFSQTTHLDRWDAEGIEFIFGIDAMAPLRQRAESLSDASWTPLARMPKYEVQTTERARRENVKERIIRERGFKNIRTVGESVAEFDYRPGACARPYRVIVLRKNLSVQRGETALIDDVRYFFFITNDRELTAAEVVLLANARCNQENLIEQLKNGVHALKLPTSTLHSNWAYMVVASLAWTLKAWFALLLPETSRWKDKHAEENRTVLTMEFKRFQNAFIRLPAQVVRQGRRVVLRLLAWNPWLHVFLRGAAAFG